MNNKELIEKIDETNNIGILIKILKKINFDNLDADTLAKIISILDNKKELYEKRNLRGFLVLLSIIFGGLGILTNVICLLINGFHDMPIVEAIKNVFDLFTTNKSSISHYFAEMGLAEFFSNVRILACVSMLGGSGLYAFCLNSDLFHFDPSPKKLVKYNEYKELMDVIYKSKVEDLNVTLKKCEEERIPNETLLIRINQKVIRYLDCMPKDLKKQYTNSFNQMLEDYKEKCRECDKSLPDTPAIADDLKLAYFKELVSKIKDFLDEIKPIVEKADNDTLISKFTTSLNQILEIPNSKEACDAFINLSNKTLDSLKNVDVETFNIILDLISDYFLLMISKDAVNATYLIYNLNPYFYGCITDKIKQKLMSTNNIEAIMNINNIEGKKEFYSPFVYVSEMVQLYLCNISKEDSLTNKNELQTS